MLHAAGSIYMLVMERSAGGSARYHGTIDRRSRSIEVHGEERVQMTDFADDARNRKRGGTSRPEKT